MTPANPDRSRAFAVVGPSGSGKDTLIAAVAGLPDLPRLPDLHPVRRVITRPESAGGEPFEGVTEAEFAARAAAGAFALVWQAHGLQYAIPASAVAAHRAGHTVIFNGSRAMLGQAAEVFPGLTVLLVTARPETLAARLAARGRESREDIAARLARAEFALPPGLPVIRIDNDGPLDAAAAAMRAALQPESS